MCLIKTDKIYFTHDQYNVCWLACRPLIESIKYIGPNSYYSLMDNADCVVYVDRTIIMLHSRRNV